MNTMKRPANLAIIQIFALAFGLFVAVSTWLGNLMNPLASGLGTVVLWCAVVIVVITAGVLVELRSTSILTRWFVAAAVLTGLIGLVPAAKYISDRWADAAYGLGEEGQADIRDSRIQCVENVLGRRITSQWRRTRRD